MDMNNDAWLYGKRQPLVVAVGVLTIKVHFEQDWGKLDELCEASLRTAYTSTALKLSL